MKNKRKKYTEYNKKDLIQIRKIYKSFKQCNTYIKEFDENERMLNTPIVISETLVAYLYGYKRNTGCPGDLTNKHGLIVEVKTALVTKRKDLSSFSPSAKFSDLCYAELDLDNDTLTVWELGLSSNDIEKIKVSQVDTVKDQKNGRRRPRFSIRKTIIESDNLEPDYIFNIKNLKIIGGKLCKNKS